MTKGIIKALSISILIHGLLFYYLITKVQLGDSPLAPVVKTKKPVIQSYVYKKPKPIYVEPIKIIEIPSESKPETITLPENKAEETIVKAIEKPVKKAKQTEVIAPPLPEQIKTLPVETTTLTKTQPVAKPIKKSVEKKAVFNPYKAGKSLNDRLDQEMFDQYLEQREKTQGISPMQDPQDSVPERVYKKTELEKREEATTQVGNETFVKQDGVCMQTTDLGFIDDNLGKVTSFSDCGETDEERYFREFMAEKLKYQQKKK